MKIKLHIHGVDEFTSQKGNLIRGAYGLEAGPLKQIVEVILTDTQHPKEGDTIEIEPKEISVYKGRVTLWQKSAEALPEAEKEALRQSAGAQTPAVKKAGA